MAKAQKQFEADRVPHLHYPGMQTDLLSDELDRIVARARSDVERVVRATNRGKAASAKG